MLMRYENGLHFFHLQSQFLHPPFRFSARNTCVYENRLGFIADIKAVTIAAGVEGREVEGHFAKVVENCEVGGVRGESLIFGE